MVKIGDIVLIIFCAQINHKHIFNSLNFIALQGSYFWVAGNGYVYVLGL